MTLHLPEVVGAVTAGIAGSLAYVRMRQQIAAKAKRVADTTTHEEPHQSVVDAVEAPHAAVATPIAEVAAPAAPSDVPAPTKGRMRGLVERLGRSNSVFGGALMTLLSSESGAQTDWESVEDTLILADLGARPSQELVERLRRKVDAKAGVEAIRRVVRDELLSMVDVSGSRDLNLLPPGAASVPQVVIVVGVNGTGKTTTTGKLARMLKADGYSVVLAAADTFRAAAADQLQTWGDRVDVPVVRKDAGADPASVAFEGLDVATKLGADVLVVDTAGRLHTKTGLMDELGKLWRVLERTNPVSEVLLVLDATTGQNGLVQAKVFAEAVAVTGVALTKLDGTAKGGIVVAVQRDLGVPVKFVGLGEGADDLAGFDGAAFVDALLA